MRNIILGGILLLALVLQVTVLPHLPLFGVTPDLLLLITIAYALLRGSDEGKWFGLVAGLAADLFLGRWFGVQALLKMLAGYSVGWFAGKYFIDHLGIPILMTLLGVTAQEFLLYMMTRISSGLPWQFGWFFTSAWPWLLLYNLMLIPWIYRLMLKFNTSMRRVELTTNRSKRPGR